MIREVIAGALLKPFSALDPRRARLLRLRLDHLTYLSMKDLANLQGAVRDVERDNVEGVFIEAGCALGGSAIAISMAKAQQREFIVYDTFKMIPPPSARDLADVHERYEVIKSGKAKGIGSDPYYGYVENLKLVVEQNLARYGFDLRGHNISLEQGFFEDTLHVTGPVAFAHIDCDWYNSVMTCLRRIEPNLSVGGVMVFDDYYVWSGCRVAVDEYFEDRMVDYDISSVHQKLHVRRLQGA